MLFAWMLKYSWRCGILHLLINTIKFCCCYCCLICFHFGFLRIYFFGSNLEKFNPKYRMKNYWGGSGQLRWQAKSSSFLALYWELGNWNAVIDCKLHKFLVSPCNSSGEFQILWAERALWAGTWGQMWGSFTPCVTVELWVSALACLFLFLILSPCPSFVRPRRSQEQVNYRQEQQGNLFLPQLSRAAGCCSSLSGCRVLRFSETQLVAIKEPAAGWGNKTCGLFYSKLLSFVIVSLYSNVYWLYFLSLICFFSFPLFFPHLISMVLKQGSSLSFSIGTK